MLRRLIEAEPDGISGAVVVSLTSIGLIGQHLQSRGVRVHRLGMRSVFDTPVALLRLARLINHYQPEVIQTWMYHADLLGGVAARLAGKRNIVWGIRRSNASFSSLGLTWLVMKINALLSRAIPSKIVCVAETARNIHVAAGYDSSRMVVIPNGFEFERLKATAEQRIAMREACGFAASDIVVGCVGRFDPDKDQANFVKAAAIVLSKFPNAKFLMVGRDCDSRNDKLTAWLSQFGAQDNFVLLGERSDIPECLSAMDVFCMPSRTEGFPNGLGEAMAMGLPCVATRVGDTFALAGDTVALVPAQNDQALAEALLSVINLPGERRSQMGQASKARVIDEFSIEKAASQFKAVYEEVISGTKT